jgi:Rad9
MVHIKPLVNVLRQNQTQVETAFLELGNDRLTLEIKCKHSVVKTHSFTYQDVEASRAIFDQSACENKIQTSCKTLHSILCHFPPQIHDVTMDIKRYSFTLSSNDVSDKNLSTSINIDIQEFESYVVEKETTLSTNLKDLKATLNFAQSLMLPIKCHFSSQGRLKLTFGDPFIISCSPDEEFMSVEFVLATIYDENAEVANPIKEVQQVSSQDEEIPASPPRPTARTSIFSTLPNASTPASIRRLSSSVALGTRTPVLDKRTNSFFENSSTPATPKIKKNRVTYES